MIPDEAIETRTDTMSDNQDLEDKQHARVMKVLKSHFGHSSVESDLEDAAWSILAVLDEYLIDDPNAFPMLKENIRTEPMWSDQPQPRTEWPDIPKARS